MSTSHRARVWRSILPLLACLLIGCFASVAWAQTLQPVPGPDSHVVDTTNTLDTAARQTLEQKLTAFETETGTQIGVLLVPTTAPEDIFSYANRAANLWKLGRKDVGDGLLVVVAKDDRKLRIEVAKTLEGAIPDLMAKRVIDEAITPAFKQGDFAMGLDTGVDQLMALVRGEALPAPPAETHGNGGDSEFQWMDWLVFLVFAAAIGGSIARSIFGNRLGSLLAGAVSGLAVWVVTHNVLAASLAGIVSGVFTLLGALDRGGSTGRSGSGSSGSYSSRSSSSSRSSGGGGFSSGGGGNFGGGGASGGW